MRALVFGFSMILIYMFCSSFYIYIHVYQLLVAHKIFLVEWLMYKVYKHVFIVYVPNDRVSSSRNVYPKPQPYNSSITII